ncbi:flavoprotein [Actinosynnema sp. NPDC059797]
MSDTPRWLYLVVCAAPPVLGIDQAITLLGADGRRVCLIATPTAATWIDLDDLAARTGCLTRSTALPPGQQESLPRADAVLAAPLTFNSINKWAGGISDCLALGVLNELLSTDVPIIAAPCVKPSLRSHPAYRPSIEVLTTNGVTFLDTDAMSVIQNL